MMKNKSKKIKIKTIERKKKKFLAEKNLPFHFFNLINE